MKPHETRLTSFPTLFEAPERSNKHQPSDQLLLSALLLITSEVNLTNIKADMLMINRLMRRR